MMFLILKFQCCEQFSSNGQSCCAPLSTRLLQRGSVVAGKGGL